jgi:hypothetical protein
MSKPCGTTRRYLKKVLEAEGIAVAAQLFSTGMVTEMSLPVPDMPGEIIG